MLYIFSFNNPWIMPHSQYQRTKLDPEVCIRWAYRKPSAHDPILLHNLKLLRLVSTIALSFNLLLSPLYGTLILHINVLVSTICLSALIAAHYSTSLRRSASSYISVGTYRACHSCCNPLPSSSLEWWFVAIQHNWQSLNQFSRCSTSWVEATWISFKLISGTLSQNPSLTPLRQRWHSSYGGNQM